MKNNKANIQAMFKSVGKANAAVKSLQATLAVRAAR